MKRYQLSIIVCNTAIASLVALGCTSLPKPDLAKLKPPGPAQTVVAVWEPAVNTNGDKPVRGFGGRIYFYDQSQTKPVKIHGSLVVYLFNEEGRTVDNTKPDEGYVFDDKTLNSKSVYKKSKLGPSYNLWIPVDSEGAEGKAKKVSLIVRYIPKKGAAVISEQAAAYLPGKREPNTMLAQTEPGGIQQVGALLPKEVSEKPRLTEETPIETNENRPKTMQTITIK
ncbi:MAG: hypothetical protein LBT89_05785 [Planctomycetaceae bacterium]|jgi:hypothetical protein|nr:hypothetical protein [Planctomycetaceae bacterium]